MATGGSSKDKAKDGVPASAEAHKIELTAGAGANWQSVGPMPYPRVMGEYASRPGVFPALLLNREESLKQGKVDAPGCRSTGIMAECTSSADVQRRWQVASLTHPHHAPHMFAGDGLILCDGTLVYLGGATAGVAVRGWIRRGGEAVGRWAGSVLQCAPSAQARPRPLCPLMFEPPSCSPLSDLQGWGKTPRDFKFRDGKGFKCLTKVCVFPGQERQCVRVATSLPRCSPRNRTTADLACPVVVPLTLSPSPPPSHCSAETHSLLTSSQLFTTLPPVRPRWDTGLICCSLTAD